jgi:asparagine synthase (glutamine-hydrolysing)
VCGICGVVNFDESNGVSQRTIMDMMGTLRHRGPDDEGSYLKHNVALGHTRLSIIDLGTGHQPICNEDGSVWIVFNGEVYNYRSLRSELAATGHRFQTESDTETIVHLYEEDPDGFASRLRGMFAIAIWDSARKRLVLVRDRVGIKPLYYCETPTGIIFASEVKAILASGRIRAAVDETALRTHLTYLHTAGDATLFAGVRKVLPGFQMTLQDGQLTPTRYWDLLPSYAKSRVSLREAEHLVADTLRESVGLHMISDVPVGILLSGGLDSTALLNLARQQYAGSLSTFTVGFGAETFADERYYAGLAASRYGVPNYSTTFTASDFLHYLPDLVWHLEEPVCEPPAVALHYVTELARGHVKVLISGEGGDEAFAGYPNYRNMRWLERAKRLLGAGGSRAAAAMLSARNGARSRKYAELLRAEFPGYYLSRTADPSSLFVKELDRVAPGGTATNAAHASDIAAVLAGNARHAGLDPLDTMLYIDLNTWLPDDLLVKADKVTMASSIELRVPLLDHRLLEVAASLPTRFKVHGFTTKYVLKKVLMDSVPREIIRRRKAGFPVPYARWLQNDLREPVLSLLNDRRTLERPYLDGRYLKRVLLTRPQGDYSLSKELFTWIMLELWFRRFIDGESVVLG